MIELKVFNGLIHKNNKQLPQYLHFRCGMTHLNYYLKKVGKTFKLPKEILETEMNHDDNYKIKKLFGYLMLKATFSVVLTHTLDILKLWKK